jgi:hypothetical protein
LLVSTGIIAPAVAPPAALVAAPALADVDGDAGVWAGSAERPAGVVPAGPVAEVVGAPQPQAANAIKMQARGQRRVGFMANSLRIFSYLRSSRSS